MNTQLTKVENTVAQKPIEFTEEQINLIKALVAEKATDNELKLFLYQCSRTGLDPLTRQIYCIHRKQKTSSGGYVEKMSIQTSIDGFRVIAERSGVYAGQDEPVFMYNDNKQLIGAKVTVYKFDARGNRYPAAVGVAYWSEYCPTSGDAMWRKMPHTMIAKVAEALALRKAFPQDLSGLYTSEEMEQDSSETQETSFKYNAWMQQELINLLATSTYKPGSKEYTAIKKQIAIENLPESVYNRIKAGLTANQQPLEQQEPAETIDFEEVASS